MGRDPVLDTSVCVHLLRGDEHIRAWITQRRATARVLVHTVVVAELIAGVKGRRDIKAVDALIASTTPLVPTAHDLAASLPLLRRYGLSHGVEWHDCLIAATALRVRSGVATINVKHFQVIPRVIVESPLSMD